MRRFYKDAEVASGPDGHVLLLDGRPVKTPARNALHLPTPPLAEAVRTEWQDQGEVIDPRAMPLTGLANAALDRVAPDTQGFAASLAQYGETDLLCYRADGPDRLVARQSQLWDPLLAWARRRYDVELKVTTGIIHHKQPSQTVARLANAVAARGPFELAGLSPLVTVGGSLVIALALAEQAVGTAEAWNAAALDDQWQAEQWGEDAEAAAALENRRRDFEAGARFLDLLRG